MALVHRLDPLHKRQLPGVAYRADGEHRLDKQESGGKQRYLQNREVIGDFPEQTKLIEAAADQDTMSLS